MKLRLGDPQLARELAQALNETECLAACTAGSTVDVFVPWLADGQTPDQAAAEVLFFARAWGASRPGFRVLLDPRF